MIMKLKRKIASAKNIFNSRGIRGILGAVKLSVKGLWTKQATQLFVSIEDAADVDWTELPERITSSITVKDGPINIAWIMSVPGPESGGHQNLFRFIRFAEEAGHNCSIYLYSASEIKISISDLELMLRNSDAFPKVNATIEMFNRERGFSSDTQAIFATGWETAYPVFLANSHAKRFYFVQDYEPLFYPTGSDALLAENTYRFGFHGITAGRWLAESLAEKYAMKTDFFDFAVDTSLYHLTNRSPRSEIFFYARPVTPRRAFEFGLIALNDFAKLRPDITINFAGWDVSKWEIPFEHNNLSSLSLNELNDIYNRCAAGLVLSLTNMSLLPLELLSSGVTPVVNEGLNNSLVSNNPYIEYVPASPKAIARKLVEIIERPDADKRILSMSNSVSTTNWEDSAKQFLKAFERAMHG
jgi:glycosyltransferase involved in cell wall biosynthesis